jgi:hypothetical protein
MSELGTDSTSVGSQPPSKRQNNGEGSSVTILSEVASPSCGNVMSGGVVPLVQGDQWALAHSMNIPLVSSPPVGSPINALLVPPTTATKKGVPMDEVGTKDQLGPSNVSPVVVVRPSPPTTPSDWLVSSPLLVEHQSAIWPHMDMLATEGPESGEVEQVNTSRVPLIQVLT